MSVHPSAPETSSIWQRFCKAKRQGHRSMVAVLGALIVANSPLSSYYTAALHAYVGGLRVLHWINDSLMAMFFLLVGLELKREMLDGQLSTWPARALSGLAGWLSPR